MSNTKSQRKFRLLPEGADQSAASLTAPQVAAGFASQFRKVFRTEVGQGMAFEVAPDVFNRVEFGRVSGQTRQDDLAFCAPDVPLHGSAAMDGQTVPDHQQFTAHLAAEVAEKLCGLPAFDTAAIESKIELPPGNASDDRDFAPGMTENQLRRLAFGCPSAHDAGALRKAAFVHKDKGAAFLHGLFFSAGQVYFFQRAMASSSRWAAWPVGRWTLQPIRPNTRQTWPGCRRTPFCRWISSATRGRVQRSLRKPWAWAPCRSAFSKCCLSVGLSLEGRPKGRRFQAE